MKTIHLKVFRTASENKFRGIIWDEKMFNVDAVMAAFSLQHFQVLYTETFIMHKNLHTSEPVSPDGPGGPFNPGAPLSDKI